MIDEIKRTLEMIQQFSSVVEIRILKANKYGGTYSGYYDNVNTAAQDVLKYNSKVPAIYITLNQIEPALLARANNRMDENAKHTTTDADVLRRVWLYIDIDPKRPAGISSTDEEHIAAIQKAYHIRDALLLFGWPEPVLCDSGNGASLLYKIDMENSIQTLEIVNSALKAMDYFFSDEKIQIDQAVFNAARIVKLYGTKARKGDSTIDRPHRDSKILELPAEIQVLTPEMIQAFIIKIPEDETETLNEIVDSGSGFDLQNWLSTNNISVKNTKPWNGGTIYSLVECPFNFNHKAPDSSIIQQKSGAISFHCFHNSCQEHTWKELRDLKEPKRDDKKQTKPTEEKNDNEGLVDVSVLDAVAAMRKVCDGAEKKDGRGFSRFHRPIVYEIMSIAQKGEAELYRLYKILIHYHKQLGKMGLRVINPRENQTKTVAINGNLLKYVERDDIELFHDEAGTAYARIPINDKLITLQIGGKQFKQWLGRENYVETHSVLRSDAISAAINVIEGKCCYEGKKYKLYNRLCWHEGAIWYDLGDWTAVKIRPEGWEIVNNPPILFKKYSHQLPHDVSKIVSGGNEDKILGNLNKIFKYVNVSDEATKDLF